MLGLVMEWMCVFVSRRGVWWVSEEAMIGWDLF